jgi:hypothetical protein
LGENTSKLHIQQESIFRKIKNSIKSIARIETSDHKWAKNWTDIWPNRMYAWQLVSQKDAECHSLLGNGNESHNKMSLFAITISKIRNVTD